MLGQIRLRVTPFSHGLPNPETESVTVLRSHAITLSPISNTRIHAALRCWCVGTSVTSGSERARGEAGVSLHAKDAAHWAHNGT